MQFHDISEYINQHMPKTQFYVQDLLPRMGRMIIFGAPKVGKSVVAQQLGFCIATGVEWLGFRVEQARVLIINFELTPLDYFWRLKKMSKHFVIPPQVLYEASPGYLYIDDVNNFAWLAESVKAISPDVIILDCLSAFFGGDENDSRDMANLIKNMEHLRTENEASIIVVHHSNKSIQSGSFVDLIRGHSKLGGWVDSIMYEVEQPGGRQLWFRARQAERELPPMNIQLTDGLLERR